MPPARDLAPAGAWRFIILLGIISLFSDITYEGTRSISGPFLGKRKARAQLLALPFFLAVSSLAGLKPR